MGPIEQLETELARLGVTERDIRTRCIALGAKRHRLGVHMLSAVSHHPRTVLAIVQLIEERAGRAAGK